MSTFLDLSWSVSRGRDTYGYNICRLDDTSTGKRYRCNGGGYDMVGTVFADWLQDTYQTELQAIKERAYARYTETPFLRTTNGDGLYGMTRQPDDRITLDGACGLSSMERIAKEIGLSVQHTVNRRGNVTGFIVERTS